jgi:hypothetical protein
MGDCKDEPPGYWHIPTETIRERTAREKREQRQKKARRRMKEIGEYPPHLWKPGFPGGSLAFRAQLRRHAIEAGGGSLGMVGTDVIRLLDLLEHHLQRHRLAAGALARFAPTTAGFEEVEDLPWREAVAVTATAGAIREAYTVSRLVDVSGDSEP